MADSEYRNPFDYRKQKKERNGYATGALIMGMMSVINLCCFSFTTSIVLGVGAVSFAFISKKEQKLSTPAKLAIFLGVGSVVFGVIEYVVALQLFELVKAPENIAEFNRIYEEAEKMLESQEALREALHK